MNKLIKLTSLLVVLNTYADDTDIYTSLDSGVDVNKRAVFLMDTSGSMGWAANSNCSGSSCETRMEVVQKVARDVISDPEFDDLEIALMRFDHTNNYNGGYLLTDFMSLSDDTSQNQLLSQIDGLNTFGGTPLKEAISEAARFLRGDESLYSKYFDPDIGCSSHYETWNNGNRDRRACFSLKAGTSCTRKENDYVLFSSGWNYKYNICTEWQPSIGERSVPESFESPGKYKTAFKQTCDAPHIIAFTDGESSVDIAEDSTIINNYSSLLAAGKTPATPIDNNNDSQHHLKLAFWLNNQDHNASLKGDQSIVLNTIGGFNDNLDTLLEGMAKNGGGTFGSGSDYTTLKKALGEAINNVLENGSTFVSPQVAVSSDNTLEVGSDVYVSVFKPTKGAAWSGNVKRYERDSSGFIIDKNKKRIFDSSTGFFSDKSHSFWSEDVDGNDIEAGGIASRIKNRKLYTTTKDNSSAVLFDNANVQQSEFNSASSLDSLANYLKNKDAEGNELKRIADPLHSKPLVVTYASGERTLFITTNAGFLHAFNPSLIEGETGERYAFIPRALLPRAAAYHDKSPSKVYGLDLTPYLWHKDTNGNLKIDSNEKAYLYLGMRRGGRDYYIVDISNPNKPVMVDHIQGGSGAFANLGQTWALPLRARIKWRDSSGNSKDALVISGGYDTAPDTSRTNLEGPHSTGKDVFIIDPETNSVLWKASDIMTLDYAIPNRPTLIDDDRDGFHDTMYLTDLSGKILRFDFNPEATSKSNFAKGGIIADLSTNSGITRFFSRPDISYVNYSVTLSDSTDLHETRYQLAVGSGNRAIPNGKNIQNHFFVLYDFLVKSSLGVTWDNINYTNICIPSGKTQLEKNEANGSYQIYTICRDDLAKSTVASSADSFTSFQISRQGFYFELPDSGEKVLARGITLNNNITFSSFQPRSSNASTCQPSGGQTRRYSLLFDGGFTLTSTDQQISSIEDELEIIISAPPSSPGEKPASPSIGVSQEGGLNGGQSLGDDSLRPYGVLRWEVQ